MNKTLVLLIIIGTLSSCKNQEEVPTPVGTAFIGEWLRTDATENFTYTLVFYEDQTGYFAVASTDSLGQSISTAQSMDWALRDEVLTLVIADEVTQTTHAFDSEGKLYLYDFSEYPFEKVE